MLYINTVEFYSLIKKREIVLFVEKHMEVEMIMLSKVSQTQVKSQDFSPMQKEKQKTSKGRWQINSLSRVS